MSSIVKSRNGTKISLVEHDTVGAGVTAAELAWLSLSHSLRSLKSLPVQPVEVPASATSIIPLAASTFPVPTLTSSATAGPLASPSPSPPIPQRQHQHQHQRQRHPTPLSPSPPPPPPPPSSPPSLSPSLSPSLATHTLVTLLSHLSCDVLPRSRSYSPSEVGPVPSSLSFITTDLRPGDFHIHYVNQHLQPGLRPHLDPPLISNRCSIQYQSEEYIDRFVPPRPLSLHSSRLSVLHRQLGNLFLGRKTATQSFSILPFGISVPETPSVEGNLALEHHEPNLLQNITYPSTTQDTDKMGLMRAFTSARRSATPQRSLTTLNKGRPYISLPTELISTTNILSYTAPSIESMRAVAPPSSPTSMASPAGSNRASFAASEEPSLTDGSSINSVSSPGSPDSPNRHEYFRTPEKPTLSIKTDSAVSVVDMDSVSPTTLLPTPVLPRRAPSHSKHEHVRLAHRRSQRVQSHQPLSATSPLTSLSSEPLSAVSDMTEKHPFSQELEQLNEVVEELGALIDGEDERVMEMLGLRKWTPEEYVSDVQFSIGDGDMLFA